MAVEHDQEVCAAALLQRVQKVLRLLHLEPLGRARAPVSVGTWTGAPLRTCCSLFQATVRVWVKALTKCTVRGGG